MQIPAGKRIYFISDFHLGAPDHASSLTREKKITSFLDSIRDDMHALFILGDIFDFWYEYRRVVPKGFVRILGKLAEISDASIPVYFFVGNHDMWMKDYFEKELNITVYFHPRDFEINGKAFHIGHGDGLGPGDKRYKALKKVFRNPFCQWLFGILPASLGMGIADYFSRKSRAATGHWEQTFLGEDREWLIGYAREALREKNIEFFVFGHRHLPVDYRLTDKSRYINLGDWIIYDTYATFDGLDMKLRSHTGKDEKITRNW